MELGKAIFAIGGLIALVGVSAGYVASCGIDTRLVMVNNTPEGVFINVTPEDEDYNGVAVDGTLTIDSIEGVPVNRSFDVKASDFKMGKREMTVPVQDCDVRSVGGETVLANCEYVQQRKELDYAWYPIKDEILLPTSPNFKYVHRNTLNMTNSIQCTFRPSDGGVFGGMQMLDVDQVLVVGPLLAVDNFPVLFTQPKDTAKVQSSSSVEPSIVIGRILSQHNEMDGYNATGKWVWGIQVDTNPDFPPVDPQSQSSKDMIEELSKFGTIGHSHPGDPGEIADRTIAGHPGVVYNITYYRTPQETTYTAIYITDSMTVHCTSNSPNELNELIESIVEVTK